MTKSPLAPRTTARITIFRGKLATSATDAARITRLLILTFIYSNHFEGIGFLLAAKSIFRFGDLNKAKNVRTTEYVLLGTLMSFAISILIGFSVAGFSPETPFSQP